MNGLLLQLLSIGSIISAILVITTQNPVIAVLYIIGVFVIVAGYLILIGLNFIGLTYLVVYVGAIAILFLFVVIMINIKLIELNTSELQISNKLPLAILLGSLFLYQILNLSNVQTWTLFDHLTLLNNIKKSENTVINWDTTIINFEQLESIGLGLYTVFSIWLIVISLILLLAIVGPIVMCLRPTKALHY